MIKWRIFFKVVSLVNIILHVSQMLNHRFNRFSLSLCILVSIVMIFINSPHHSSLIVKVVCDANLFTYIVFYLFQMHIIPFILHQFISFSIFSCLCFLCRGTGVHGARWWCTGVALMGCSGVSLPFRPSYRDPVIQYVVAPLLCFELKGENKRSHLIDN